MEIGTHYVIEWLVPEGNAIGGKEYWFKLNEKEGYPYREQDLKKALAQFHKTEKIMKEKVRLVKITAEVIIQREK